jgi:LysM repeat protein
MVEKSGDSYLVFAIKTGAIIYEDEQKISYQHPHLHFKYVKTKTSNQQVLNPTKNRNYNIFYKNKTTINCIDAYAFESIPHCQKEAIIPITWLSGIGFGSLREGKHQLQLKRINRLPLKEYLQQHCGYFDDDLKMAPTTLYVASSSPLLRYTVAEQTTKSRLAVAKSAHSIAKHPAKSTEVRLDSPQDFYTAQYQDCLYSISRQFNISINRLVELNQLLSYDIKLNQSIKVIDDPSVPKQKRYPIIKIDELSGSKTIIHLAQQGQTLYGIAKLYALSLPQLYAMNHHLKNDQIDINQHLVVGIISK